MKKSAGTPSGLRATDRGKSVDYFKCCSWSGVTNPILSQIDLSTLAPSAGDPPLIQQVGPDFSRLSRDLNRVVLKIQHQSEEEMRNIFTLANIV